MHDNFPETGLLWTYESDGIFSAEIYGFLLKAAPVSRDLEYGFQVSKQLVNKNKSHILIGYGHCKALEAAMIAAERFVEDFGRIH